MRDALFFAATMLTWTTGCASAAQDGASAAVVDRPPIEAVRAGVDAALGSSWYAKSGEPFALAGRAYSMGIEDDVSLLKETGPSYVLRLAGPLGITKGFDGETAWETGYDGTTRATGLQERDDELFMQWLLDGTWLSRRVPIDVAFAEEDVDGTLLEVTLRETPTRALVQLDPETSLPTTVRRDTTSGPRTWELSEWREVGGGLQLAHEVRMRDAEGPRSWVRWEEASPLPTFVRSPFEPVRGAPRDTRFDPSIPNELDTQKLFSGHVLVHPTIDGEDVGWFILDTGAGGMCIDRAVAEDLGLETIGEVVAVGVSGRETTRFRQGASFALGPLRYDGPIYVELDLAFLSDVFGEEIAGIVGYELFARSIVEFEPTTGHASIFEPSSYTLEGADWQPMILDARVPAVEADFEGHTGHFRLDTGAGGTVTFHSPTVKAHDLLAGRELTRAGAGGVGGMTATWRGTLAWFELAGHRFESPTVEFAETEIGGLSDPYLAGNLGQGFLEPFRLVLDYANARIAFVERGGGSK